MRIFLICDWAYVAAPNHQDAMEWYGREFPNEEELADFDWVEVDGSKEMNVAEEGAEPQKATMAEVAQGMIERGQIMPFIVAIDPH